ncbi:MAG: hypothetical protein M1448_03790 [Candidatus Marsarchaeota archaeon]|jgi:hypothetical protein|nr:hypothetical protein [Candidatus Marsarchaeota archaeon]
MHGVTSGKKMGAQSPIEYIVTYSWAIAIIALALAALFAFGVLKPSSFINNQCAFPAEFSCTNETLFTNGTLAFDFGQATESQISLTAMGCNQYESSLVMNAITPLNLQVGFSTPISMPCYSGSSLFTSQPGKTFSGDIVVNYTDVQSGVEHTVTGSVILKST